MSKKIEIKGNEITIVQSNQEDYISIIDIAKHKNPEATGLVISHWMSTRYTIEFMGLWEKMHNPDFNVTEFSNIKNEARRKQRANHDNKPRRGRPACLPN